MPQPKQIGLIKPNTCCRLPLKFKKSGLKFTLSLTDVTLGKRM